MLFIRRSLKDLGALLLFGMFFYVATHNAIVRPKIEKNNSEYRIELLQEPLVLGIAGHNFLVLRDDKNQIKNELHGLATDTSNHWKYLGNEKSDKLKVWEFNSPLDFAVQKNETGILLYTGTSAQVYEQWEKARNCKEKINQLNISYPPFGVNIHGETENSNSVAYTLTLCMGLNTKHIGLLTPGSTKNLLP